jgi:hypothetical protein
MHKFVGLAVISGLLVSYSFFTQAQSVPELCNKHLRVSEASAEKWNPGIVVNNGQHSGGMIYSIQIKIRKNGYVTFNNLILESEVLPIEVVKDGKRDVNGSFKKGDVITLIARSDKKKPQNPPGSPISTKLKNKKAEIGVLYTYKGKQYLHALDHVIIKQSSNLSQ